MLNFGAGQLMIVPPGANATPVQIGTLQDVSLDMKFTKKKLYGAFQMPVDSARAQAEWGGKIKAATINSGLLSSFLTGSTVTTGQNAGAINEPWTIPATPFQVTVSQSATFLADNGVVDGTAGIQMTQVPSGPITGQYSVAAGVYTFALADVGHAVLISYEYTLTTGKTTHFTNQLMGSGQTYVMRLFNIFRGKNLGYTLYAVTIDGLSWPMKNEDYTIQDLEYDVYADSLARIADLYTGD